MQRFFTPSFVIPDSDADGEPWDAVVRVVLESDGELLPDEFRAVIEQLISFAEGALWAYTERLSVGRVTHKNDSARIFSGCLLKADDFKFCVLESFQFQEVVGALSDGVWSICVPDDDSFVAEIFVAFELSLDVVLVVCSERFHESDTASGSGGNQLLEDGETVSVGCVWHHDVVHVVLEVARCIHVFRVFDHGHNALETHAVHVELAVEGDVRRQGERSDVGGEGRDEVVEWLAGPGVKLVSSIFVDVHRHSNTVELGLDKTRECYVLLMALVGVCEHGEQHLYTCVCKKHTVSYAVSYAVSYVESDELFRNGCNIAYCGDMLLVFCFCMGRFTVVCVGRLIIVCNFQFQF